MDATSGDYGGYCIVYNSGDADTYYIDATDFADEISTYTISSDY